MTDPRSKDALFMVLAALCMGVVLGFIIGDTYNRRRDQQRWETQGPTPPAAAVRAYQPTAVDSFLYGVAISNATDCARDRCPQAEFDARVATLEKWAKIARGEASPRQMFPEAR